MLYKHKAVVEPLKEIQGMKEALQYLRDKGNVKVVNMVNSCKGHFAYGVSSFLNIPMVIITYDEVSTKQMIEDLSLLVGKENIMVYPGRDILFYNADVHSMDITSERIRVINALQKGEDYIFIMSIESLLNPISPKQVWEDYSIDIKEGNVINIRNLENKFVNMGYERVGKVEGIGQFSIRGGIIDIYTPIYEFPYRIELWDEEVDSIRMFNVQTQRSVSKQKSIRIVPNQEIVFDLKSFAKYIANIQDELKQTATTLREKGKKESAIRIEEQVKQSIEQIQNEISPRGLELYIPYTDIEIVSILDYLPKETVLVMDEPIKIISRYKTILEEYRISMSDRLEYGHILPSQIDFIWKFEDIVHKMKKFSKLDMMQFDADASLWDVDYTLELRVHENTSFYQKLDILEKDLKEWKQANKRVAILVGSKVKAMRLMDELEERGILASYSENEEEIIEKGQILIYKGGLSKGFYYSDIDLYVVADSELFGKEKKAKKSKKKFKGAKIESFLELSPGDYVVHERHGIGVFEGVEQIVFEGISRDNLKIEYADGNKLYVNINQMDMVQKYVGAEGKTPKLSKLGGNEWKKSKAKVKGAMKNIAKELIQLYSKRQFDRGFEYGADTTWQREFEEMFPYEETGDQLEAIEDVKRDMESKKIMDRLICGDVGYGKTEVAIRAAFKAVQNSKQVAYLVPTTILAQQHYQRFVERMADYPIKVELLSRFRTPKQIKQSIAGLNDGSVDIIIGTHRLLSKDVKFKDLGLVIIDEEQRFGVTHKEKLKNLRNEVDVMNLTATPIPRTLHMSLIGVRDMSVLEEAPIERKPVQTYVIEYSEDFIKDAINREIGRGGQVYFLHNKVIDIEEKASSIQKLIPNARVTFAHGQMSERELEQIMLQFIEGEIDILVCTTIIETGLDISNANTIIMNDADKMGLSQLYQLRGRVGRSNRIGYAYLMYQKDKALKEVAEKRLQAIKQFTELGAGFKIAMRDLEIRGAGNLLGAQQHGHMSAIGYDLYCKMLSEVVSEEMGEVKQESHETTIEIKINAYIPNNYITDEVQKLDVYKKIASIKDEKDYLDTQEEIEDRYGNIPYQVYNLLDIAFIKALANALYITLINENNKVITIRFKENAELRPDKIPEVIKEYGRNMRFITGKEPEFKVHVEEMDKKDLLDNIKNILHLIKKLKSD